MADEPKSKLLNISKRKILAWILIIGGALVSALCFAYSTVNFDVLPETGDNSDLQVLLEGNSISITYPELGESDVKVDTTIQGTCHIAQSGNIVALYIANQYQNETFCINGDFFFPPSTYALPNNRDNVLIKVQITDGNVDKALASSMIEVCFEQGNIQRIGYIKLKAPVDKAKNVSVDITMEGDCDPLEGPPLKVDLYVNGKFQNKTNCINKKFSFLTDKYIIPYATRKDVFLKVNLVDASDVIWATDNVTVDFEPAPIIPTPTDPAPTDQPNPIPDPNGVFCGKMDVNDDGILNYIDLYEFVSVYNKTCSDIPPTTGCQGKDVRKNGVYDGVINYIDLDSFIKRYFSKVTTCNL